MATASIEAASVDSSVEAALEAGHDCVLAISGGLDSMVLLTAAARLDRPRRRKFVVATFYHGTGRPARPEERHRASRNGRPTRGRVEARALELFARSCRRAECLGRHRPHPR